jgi:hypothetical protein
MNPKRNLIVAVLILALPPACIAQFDTAAALGTVRDPSGAVVPGSMVILENIKTGIAVVTQSNDAGDFDFTNVQIGTCRSGCRIGSENISRIPGLAQLNAGVGFSRDAIHP